MPSLTKAQTNAMQELLRIAPVIVAMIVYTNSIPTNVNLISVATVLNMDAVFPTYVDGISLPIALNMNAIRTNVDVITFATRVVMIPFIINSSIRLSFTGLQVG